MSAAMFGLSRPSYQREKDAEDKKEKQGPVDEVQALKGIFYTFFNANTQSSKQQKDVLVSMTTHETSINPFHTPDGIDMNRGPNNVAEQGIDDDRFGHLDIKRDDPSDHGGLDKIVEENNEHSALLESAEAASDLDVSGDAFHKKTVPNVQRKSTISGMSASTSRRNEN